MFLHVLRVEGAFVQLHLLLLLPLGQALQGQRVQILALVQLHQLLRLPFGQALQVKEYNSVGYYVCSAEVGNCALFCADSK